MSKLKLAKNTEENHSSKPDENMVSEAASTQVALMLKLLPESEKAKFRVYKGRNLRRKMTVEDAERLALEKTLELMTAPERSCSKAERATQYLKLAICTAGFLLFVSSLVYFGAEARGFGWLAWYWSIVLEVSGALLLIYPCARILWGWDVWRCQALWSRVIVRAIGIACAVLGFYMMHIAQEQQTGSKIAVVVQDQDEVRTIEGQITRKKQSIERAEADWKLIPESQSHANRRQKARAHIDRLGSELSELEDKKLAAGKQAGSGPSAELSSSKGKAEDWQRAILLLLAVICGHGMISEFRKISGTRVFSPGQEKASLPNKGGTDAQQQTPGSMERAPDEKDRRLPTRIFAYLRENFYKKELQVCSASSVQTG